MNISSKKTKKTGAYGEVPQIVSEGQHPALRQVAEEIPLSEIKSEKIQSLIQSMKLALLSQDDGIGLAAPQIGVPLRVFLVSKRVLNPESEHGHELDEDGTESDAHSYVQDDLVCINPKIVKESKEKKWMEGEGCLSVRWVYGKVKRATRVVLRAYDENGKVFERGAGGLLAHIFQHEVDHLNGILFIDKAKDLEKVDPDEHKKARKEDRPESAKNSTRATKLAKK